ncbi:phage tail tape measure protein [Listeria booriae]|uniref:Phage tail tape measure protein n=1 Tax=Listeria booriae TaxID=1552123 RepID=A0A841Y1E2_9LIST|nr:phage tail tape measure protein [Listeria booriae]MBC1373359.1 phage tail tape measure protein [Listeria booriae]
MSNQLGALVTTASLDIDPFQASARTLDRQVKTLGQNLKATEAAFKNTGNSANAMKSKYQILGQQMKAIDALAAKNTKTYKELRDGIGDVSTASEEQKQKLLNAEQAMHKSVAQAEALRTKYNALGKEIAISSNSWVVAGKKMDDVGLKMQGAGKKISDVGMGITTKFSAPLGIGLGFAMKSAADFEAQLSSVQSISGATGAEMLKLKDLAVDLGAKTKYSATEAAQGIEELMKAGVSTQDIMNGGLAGALDLATAGELGLADAAEIASTALNAFKADNLSVTDAANLLAGAANASATDVKGLQMGLQQSAAVAAGVNLSFKDTATTLAVFAQNGLKGSDAGTSLKTMLMRLHPQTDAAAAEFERLGLLTTNTENAMKTLKDNGIKPLGTEQDVLMEQMHDLAASMAGPKASTAKVNKEFNKLLMNSGSLQSAFYDTNGDLRSMAEISDILQDSLKGMTSEQRSAALTTMFGSDAIRGANILYKEGADGVNKMYKEMSKVTAAEVAAKKMDNLKGKIEEMMGSLETLAISVGDTLIPMASDFIGVVQNLVDGFNDLSPEMQGFIAKAALVGVATGPAVLGVGAFTRNLGFLMSITGKTAQGIGKLAVNMRAGRAGADVLGSSVSKTGKGLSLATKGAGMFSLALSPLGLGIAAVSVAALGGYAAWKIWGEKAIESAQRTKKWGTDVGESADKALTKIHKFSTDGRVAVATFDADSKNSTESIKASYNGMAKVILQSIDESISALKKTYNELPPEMKSFWEESVKEAEKSAEKQKETVKKQSSTAIDIAKNAAKAGRDLTKTEQAMMSNLNRGMIDSHLATLKMSASEEKGIKAALYSDITEMTKNQIGENASLISQSAKKENAEYKKQKDNLKAMYKDTGNFEAYYASLDQLNSKHDTTLTAMMQRWVELSRESGHSDAEIEVYLESMGLKLTDLDKKAKVATDGVSVNLGILSSAAGMADIAWNSMVFDPKTGEVKTNAVEEIQKASETESGWNDLKFIIKEAKLSTNAKMTLSQALIANGKWDALTYGEKKLLTRYKPEEMQKALQDMGIWDKLDPVQQTLVAKANTAAELAKALQDIGIWNQLPQPLQKLLSADETGLETAIAKGKEAIVTYNGKKVDLKKLLSDNSNLMQKLSSGGSAIVNYNGKKIDLKQLLATNKELLNKISGSKTVISDYNGILTPTKVLKADATGLENAALPIKNIRTSWMDFYNSPSNKTITTTYVSKAEKTPKLATGTNFHKGGLAMVNDARGSNYQELITTPQGVSFVPIGRNVVLDLPRGSQVLRGDKTAALLQDIPHFANGTTLDNIPTRGMNIFSKISAINRAPVSVNKGSNDNSAMLATLNRQLQQLLESNNKSDQMIKLLINVINAISSINLNQDDLMARMGKKQGTKYDIDSFFNGGGMS